MNANQKDIDASTTIQDVFTSLPPRFLAACEVPGHGQNDTEEVGIELGFEMEHPVRPAFIRAMKRYIALHRKILRGDAGVEHKFVVAFPDGQLCNRIRGVVSAFTLAFLTDRAFLVSSFGYGETGYHDLFLNPGFDIENAGAAQGDVATFGMNSGDLGSAESFTCTNWTAHSARVLNLPGANYVNTYLYRNPFLQKRIRELFLDDDLFRPILFWLFRPVPEVLQIKDDFIRQHLSVPFLVTFHIRTEYPVSDAEYRAYNACATAVTPPDQRSASAWFVAADNEEARDTVRQKLSNSSLFYSPERFERGGTKHGLRQALVDILIASAGDHVFLTPFSSYSRVIGLYAPTPHVYMVSDYGVPEQDPHRTLTRVGEHCYRFLSKEDCAWHGHLTSVGSVLQQASCYTPAMVPDYC